MHAEPAPPRRRSTRLYGDMDGLACVRAFADPPRSQKTEAEKDRLFRDACILLGVQHGIPQRRIARVLGLSHPGILKASRRMKTKMSRV
jgi:hypothetical protein